MATKYEYIGDCQKPSPGSVGEAWPAEGCDDPESCQYGAWLFQPDGDQDAYYIDPVRDIREIRA